MSFEQYLKQEAFRNADYLAFIKNRPCSIPFCPLKADPHHVRRHYWGAGTGIKPHDYVAIPLCRIHHLPKFEKRLQLEKIIIQNLMEYIESKRKGPRWSGFIGE